MTKAERAIKQYPQVAEKFERLSPYRRALALRTIEAGLLKLQRGTVEELPGGCALHKPKFRWEKL